MYKTINLTAVCLSVLFIATSGAFAQSMPTCTENSDGEITDSDACWTDPDDLELVVYQMGLCTSEPSLPDFSDCELTFENSSGQTVNLGVGTSVTLTGGGNAPSNGTYTHGVIIISNEFGVTATKTFDRSMDGLTSSGTVCWSIAGSYDNSTETFSNPSDYLADCGAASDANPETTVAVLDSFAGGSGGTFVGSGSAPVTNGTVTATLTDSSFAAATTQSDVERLVGVVEFDSAVEIDDDTTNLNAAFNVTTGATALIDPSGTEVQAFGSGPFSVIVTAD